MSDTDFQSDLAGYKKPEFDEVLALLRDEGKAEKAIVNAIILNGLSDITTAQAKKLQPIWLALPSPYKHKLLEAFNEASEADFELSYIQVGLISLKDESPLVRAAGVDVLWEDESLETMRLLLELVDKDEAHNVKARALVGLGKFILLGEYEEIPELIAYEAQQIALKFHTDMSQPLEVRRRALEALSNSSHPEKDKLIENAYHSSDHLMKVSSVFAMGRTCDDRWEHILLDELDSDDSELVYEAVRACGEIQLESSVRPIGKLLLSDDREVQIMSIWALGEIGGKRALDILERLQENIEDEEMLDMIDEAIDVANFSLTGSRFDFDVDEDY